MEHFFIIDSEKKKILHAFETLDELIKEYPYFKYSKPTGCFGFQPYKNTFETLYFVSLDDFLEESYQKEFPTPPKLVQICNNYVRKVKIDKLLESVKNFDI